jgi:hypothetical protein
VVLKVLREAISLGWRQSNEEKGVDEQHEQFLRAVYDARTVRGNSFISDLDDIAENLGIDPVRDKSDRDLYREVMFALRDDGYLECQATRDMVPCAWVQITERGLAYFES